MAAPPDPWQTNYRQCFQPTLLLGVKNMLCKRFGNSKVNQNGDRTYVKWTEKETIEQNAKPIMKRQSILQRWYCLETRRCAFTQRRFVTRDIGSGGGAWRSSLNAGETWNARNVPWQIGAARADRHATLERLCKIAAADNVFAKSSSSPSLRSRPPNVVVSLNCTNSLEVECSVLELLMVLREVAGVLKLRGFYKYSILKGT